MPSGCPPFAPRRTATAPIPSADHRGTSRHEPPFRLVDLPVADLDRAIAFYAAVLGSAVTKEGGPGFSFGLLAHSGNEVAGCLVASEGGNAPSPGGPLVYLNAEGRIAEAVAAATAHGGRILEAVVPIGPHGFRAIVLDSEGNRIALHSPTA
ncbi:MAG: VOC family protein [Caldimonas sp.]